jgi:hypothetical protein
MPQPWPWPPPWPSYQPPLERPPSLNLLARLLSQVSNQLQLAYAGLAWEHLQPPARPVSVSSPSGLGGGSGWGCQSQHSLFPWAGTCLAPAGLVSSSPQTQALASPGVSGSSSRDHCSADFLLFPTPSPRPTHRKRPPHIQSLHLKPKLATSHNPQPLSHD